MTRMLTLPILVALACDPSAKATSSGTAAAVVPGKLSTEHEACASSADCEGELRCFDQTCVTVRGSIVAEYHEALGELRELRGQKREAVDSYRAAEGMYKDAKVDPPTRLTCKLGAALAAQAEPLLAEEAAARLHRCLLGTPAGSAQRRRALGALATLDAAGLDPTTLAKLQPADRYLSRPAAAPLVQTEGVSIKVTTDRRSRSRSFAKFIQLVEGSEVRALLAPCWQAYVAASGGRVLTVTLPVTHSYKLDMYDDFQRATLDIGDPAPGPDPQNAAHGAAATCIKAALGPVADDFARKSASETRWQVEATFVLGK